MALMGSAGGSDWKQQCADLLDGLSSDDRRILINAVATNVLAGWRPSRADVKALIEVVRGEVTVEQYIANRLSALQKDSRACLRGFRSYRGEQPRAQSSYHYCSGRPSWRRSS